MALSESALHDLLHSSALSLIALAASVLLFALATAGILLLRSRVSGLASKLASRDARLTNLAAEVEAQALLARQMSMDLEELRKRLSDEDDGRIMDNVGWTSASAPVNLNRRGQILRLSRKGKSIAEIAQDLNVAQGEVELLLKIHDLSHKEPAL